MFAVLQDVDFLIGGSIFGFLCGEGRMPHFLARKCPGANTVAISRQKTYQQNFGQRGFQLERLVTGQNMFGLQDPRGPSSLARWGLLCSDHG